jgi:hypothetical protein
MFWIVSQSVWLMDVVLFVIDRLYLLVISIGSGSSRHLRFQVLVISVRFGERRESGWGNTSEAITPVQLVERENKV